MHGLGRLGLVGIFACGCGPGPLTSGDDEGTDGGSESTGGGRASVSADADEGVPGDDDGADTGGDDDPGGDDDGPDLPVPIGLCDIPEDEPLAVTTDAAAAWLVRGDGTVIALDAASIDTPPGANVTVWATASADAVALVISWTLVQGEITHGFTLRVFDSAGDASWEHAESGATFGAIGIDAGGSVVGSRYLDGGAMQGVIYEGPSEPLVLGEVEPLGVPGEDGLVPARVPQAKSFGTLGWIDLDAGRFIPTTLAATNGWFLVREGELVYQTETAIAIERPAELDTIELGEHASSFVATHSADWILLRDGEGESWARVSLDALAIEPLDLQPPRGFSFLECYALNGSIDDAGAVYVPTRDASIARAQRFDPASQTWQALGEPVTRIDDLHAAVTGDTVIIRSDAEHTTFCPPQTFDPAVDVLEGQTWQVLRPADDLAYVLPPDAGWVTANASGTCVQYSTPTGSVVLDTRSGETLALDGTVAVLR